MLPAVPGRTTSRVVELVSPIWLSLDKVEVSFDRNAVLICVESGWRSVPPDSSISLIEHRTGGISQKIGLATPGWKVVPKDAGQLLQQEFPMGQGPMRVTL